MDNIVKPIQDLVERTITVAVGGKTYSPLNLKPVRDINFPEPLNIGSLESFTQYVTEKIDGNESKDLVVIVHEHDKVELVGHLDKEVQRRKVFVVCNEPNGEPFSFGNFLNHEDFLIKLRSMFQDSADRKSLLAFLARITAGETITQQDDGVSQTVTTSKGVSGALKQSEKAPAIVKLAPFRTFREIDQPESEFLLRLRKIGDTTQVGLFEADGGAWKLEAAKSIAKYIKKAAPKITVLS